MTAAVSSTVLVILCCLIIVAFASNAKLANPIYINVLDYGAVGNGYIDDSNTFMRAWEDVCKADSSVAVLQIPKEKVFLLKPVRFEGPCKANRVEVQIFGDIIAPKMSQWDNHNHGVWILISDVDGLRVNGTGQIDGQGDDWWACKRRENNCGRPKAVSFHDCNNLQVNGLKIANTPKTHISVHGCNNATFSHLNLTAPEHSPNTDGIDISGSTNIQIQDSFIATGDDCIAINGGTSKIDITRIACGPGHGISIGSLGSHGSYDTVEAVHVSNCNLTKTTNGARIKTWQGGSGYARNIIFERIKLTSVRYPIIIDQYYFSNGNQNEAKAVAVSDITYKNVYGSSMSREAIVLRCSQAVPCTNIVMNQVNITFEDRRHHKASSNCINAEGQSIATFPPVPCLSY